MLLVCRREKGPIAAGVAIMAGFLLVAFWMMGLEAWWPRLIGFLSLVCFSPILIAGTIQCLDPRPSLLISTHGIEDRRWGVGAIPWQAVAMVLETRVGGHRVLEVVPHDPDAWCARIPRWRRVTFMGSEDGEGPFYVLIDSLDKAPDVVLRRIMAAFEADRACGGAARMDEAAE